MSIKIMHGVWEHSPYDLGTLLVLLALADWADDEGYCFPAIPAIAKKSRLSERQVYRVLSRLEKEGSIEVVQEAAGRSKRKHYLVKTLTSCHPSQKGDIGTTERMTSATKKGDICDSAIRKNRKEPSEDTSRVRDAALSIFKAWPRQDNMNSGIDKTVSAIMKIAKRDKVDPIEAARWLWLRVRNQIHLYRHEGRDEKLVPMLATWMHQKRYDDQVLVVNHVRAATQATVDGFAAVRRDLEARRAAN